MKEEVVVTRREEEEEESKGAGDRGEKALWFHLSTVEGILQTSSRI